MYGDGELETVERCHVEVTTLLIPGENDSEEEIRDLARWLSSVDRDITFICPGSSRGIG